MISHPDLIKAALTADALNLGPHWVYDQPSLSKAYPEGVYQVSDPLSKYHPDKRAGDFTHYGDNLVLMLQSVSEEGGWNPDGFADLWRKFWSNTSSYCDGATRTTLSHLSDPTEAASRSGDIAGASLALSLTGLIGNAGEEHLIRAVRERTAFSHRDPATLDVAEFFTRVIIFLRSRHSLPNALSEAAKAEYESLDAAKELERAKAVLESEDFLQVASRFGLACSTSDAFPLVLYTLLRNPTDTSTALSENALAGGDNAARAILIALVLAEANGWDSALEASWNALTKHGELAAMVGS